MAEAPDTDTSADARERRVVWIALGALVLLMVRVILTRRDTISDDAWITMRYARNLVDGHGPLWNPGQPPVEGYSNPLWMLLGALGVALGAPMEVWIRALGTALSVAAVPLAYLVGRAAGATRRWALLGAALTALSSQIAGTARLGLETPSLVVLMTLGTALALRELEQIRAGGSPKPWSALCFGLLGITHVEAPAYIAALALARLSLRVPTREGEPAPWSLRRDGLALALAASIPFFHELFRIVYYGDWIPNTVRVKSMGSSATVSLVVGLRYVWISVAQDPALALATALGVYGLLRKREVGASERLNGLLLLAPWLLCAAFSVAARGDMINRFRFLAPAAPTLMAAVALGWQRLFARGRSPVSFALLALCLALVPAVAWRELSIQAVQHNRQRVPDELGTPSDRLWRDLNDRAGDVQIMPRALSRLWTSDLMGRVPAEVPWFIAWLMENTPPGDTVMFPDVGVMGYALWDGGILDARGLNSRGPMRLLASRPTEGPDGMNDPGVQAFLEEFHATNPCCLLVQASGSRVWGPPEAALQGAGLLQSYRVVGAGRYSAGSARIFTADRPPPSPEVVLERYRRAARDLAVEYNWQARLDALLSGSASPPDAGLDTSDVEFYPQGAWTQRATFP